jgi:hypothetical protein
MSYTTLFLSIFYYLYLNVDRQGEGGTLAVNVYIIQHIELFSKRF